jgi:hypothetical protein
MDLWDDSNALFLSGFLHPPEYDNTILLKVKTAVMIIFHYLSHTFITSFAMQKMYDAWNVEDQITVPVPAIVFSCKF